MITVLLIVHLIVTLALIGVVLIQRSEGGGLGIGSSQGMGSFMSGRGTANLLTRSTAILAAIFMALSLVLALLNKGTSGVGASILDNPPPPAAAAPGPATAPAAVPAAPPAAGTPAAGPPAAGAPAAGTPAPATPPAPKPPSVPTN
jgi:preprotein translocase subunit SecG